MTPDDFPEVFVTHGHTQIARMFRQLFALFPYLTASTQRSAAAGDAVFIESDSVTPSDAGPSSLPSAIDSSSAPARSRNAGRSPTRFRRWSPSPAARRPGRGR